LRFNPAWQFGLFSYNLQNIFTDKIINGKATFKDLLSINIQRGRDHGFPGYARYLEYFFNFKISNFTDLNNTKILPTELKTLLNGSSLISNGNMLCFFKLNFLVVVVFNFFFIFQR
jgi:hypothetical protein